MREVLANIQNYLRDSIPNARWTRPEGTHLTLKFLGDIEESLISRIAAELDGIASNQQAFHLELEGVGAFPRLASPRVIWVGIRHSEELNTLQKAIENRLIPLGFQPEERSFHGHLTLARLKGDRWLEKLQNDFLQCSKFTENRVFAVDRIFLFRSVLKPEGAVYSQLHVSPLRVS